MIPPLDELRLSLVNGFNGLTVDENKAVSAKITDVVSLTSGDRLEFASNDLPTRRDQAACSVSGNTLTYTAGRGAPWADQCMMTARLVGQSAYTTIAIPVTVTPTEPIPELHSVTKTFAPGAQTQVDLTEMVELAGRPTGRPRFAPVRSESAPKKSVVMVRVRRLTWQQTPYPVLNTWLRCARLV